MKNLLEFLEELKNRGLVSAVAGSGSGVSSQRKSANVFATKRDGSLPAPDVSGLGLGLQPSNVSMYEELNILVVVAVEIIEIPNSC